MKASLAVPVLAVLAHAVAMAGCAGSLDLVESGGVSVRVEGTTPPKRAPTVENVDGDLVVRGTLDESEAVPGGAVLVRVVGPGGDLLHSERVRYARPGTAFTTAQGPASVGRRVPAGPVRSSYEARFPGIPPQGTIVTVERVVDGSTPKNR